MNDTMFMTVLDALQDLLDAMGGVFFTVELPGNNVIEQLSPGDEIKHHVSNMVLLEHLVETNCEGVWGVIVCGGVYIV